MPMPRSPSSRGAAWPASRARRCGWRSGAASTPSCSCRRCSIPFRRGRTRTSWPRCAPASSSSSRTRGSCTGCCGCSSICPTVWGRSPAAARIRLRRPRSWSGWSSSRRACSGPECPKSAWRLIEGDHVSVQVKDFKSDLKPIWCPGCGDFGVLQAMYRALSAVGRPAHEIAFISGIGCSSRIPGYTTAYGFNTVHGRPLPIAQGVKLARPDLLVLAAGGDGDGFSIGGGHVAHAVRRNIDFTYIVMDNQIYGLTKGQLSPTSPRGRKTVTSSFGSLEDPVNPLLYVMGYGASFVAQGTPADMGGLARIIEEGIRFPGFAFINVQSPCV